MKRISLICLFALAVTVVSHARTLIVAVNTALPDLKAAVAEAADGDTIKVQKGYYYSYNTLITKRLTIIGDGYPVLDANYKEEVVTILTNGVTFSGFVLKNSKTGSMRDYAGIRLHKVHNVTISNNRLINNFFGIYLSDCDHVSVIGNTTSGTGTELTAGNGIHAWQCHDVIIMNNYSTRHRDGIYFEFVKKSRIISNTSERNFRYGLHFMFSDDDLYQKNTFRNNGSGVAVMYSKRIRMFDNLFIENWGSSIYGLLLKDITRSQIVGNRFVRNTTGIYMEGCNLMTANNNTFINNGWAMRILANCENGTFERNNFESNSFDVTTNGVLNLNKFDQNYWDKYEGYDLNKDGTGDVPYRPVSLYAQIMEQIPQSVMLMRSFMVNLLDKVERAIPSLTPESVKDINPKMKPWTR
ncbi:nitrous oxide reductase family maturation protein NosD [Mucilaginibacter gossypii]|uniref:nitrous oxide reductase family maturation protein NosD n=1 Tax=Mucilaginibacter gossypii TaxID=551996 RepID=UPI000DCBCBA6|nr:MULTISPECIES: nitrous oxide reductase family maturation protein NosD [Mucilaginibacter]QTE38217.1 nitrous oxide reductase family maturation protein NosD [Mucilaginibacter gossypii]RAV60311.1 nitrous oxide reductase family maturation protein NosD [Mucilaginibacter rubeus]